MKEGFRGFPIQLSLFLYNSNPVAIGQQKNSQIIFNNSITMSQNELKFHKLKANLVTLHVLKFNVIWLNQKEIINIYILIVKNQMVKISKFQPF